MRLRIAGFSIVLAISAVIFSVAATNAQPRKSISRAELEGILARSITVLSLNDYCKTPDGFYPGTATRIVAEAEMAANSPAGSVDDRLRTDRESGARFARYRDVLRLIRDLRPRLVTDAVTQWGAWDWHVHLARCRAAVTDIKAVDSGIVVQGSLNEFADVSTAVSIGPIPPWVWEAFGMKDEGRTFDVHRMMFPDWRRQGQDGTPQRWWIYDAAKDSLPSAVVPDIRTTEAKLWFYYAGRMFIDMGCESLSFSQVELMNNNTDDPTHWAVVFEKLRAYADTKHNIRYLLITGHTTGMSDTAGNLAFDFHSGPVRPSETGIGVDTNGGDCDLTANSCRYGDKEGKLYNRSLGGRAPSGWWCESLPGVVFIDNYGNSGPPETWGDPRGTGTCNIYGFDEITWFAVQDKAYRDSWLRYAAARVRRLDSHMFLALPVKRPVTYRKDWYPADYLANDPRHGLLDDPATIGDIPDGDVNLASAEMYSGYGQEETIRQILDAGTSAYTEVRGAEVSPAVGGWTEIALGEDLFDGPVRYRIRNRRGLTRRRGRFAERSQKIDVSGLGPGTYRVLLKTGARRAEAELVIPQ